MKFKNAFQNELRQPVTITERVRKLCNLSGKQLSTYLGSLETDAPNILITGIQFTRINFDALECTRGVIESGFLAQSFMLLRNHLELAHLFYFLWNNPDEYSRWRAGQQIRPRDIGAFFAESGLATWQETYEDWSHLAHGNEQFVEHCYTIARPTPLSAQLLVVASSALLNLMVLGHKMNMVSVGMLRDVIDVTSYNQLAREYQTIEKAIFDYAGKHKAMEKRIIAELNEERDESGEKAD